MLDAREALKLSVENLKATEWLSNGPPHSFLLKVVCLCLVEKWFEVEVQAGGKELNVPTSS